MKHPSSLAVAVICLWLASASASVTAAAAATADNERETIEWLIQRVASLRDAKFVRNGTAHDAAEAASHLRTKWKAAGNKVKTVDEFIEKLASKSSVSGSTYKIRFADGKEVNSGDWMRQELAKRAEPKK